MLKKISMHAWFDIISSNTPRSSSNQGPSVHFTKMHFVRFLSGEQNRAFVRVSVQGVESLWGDCRFIPADWGS